MKWLVCCWVAALLCGCGQRHAAATAPAVAVETISLRYTKTDEIIRCLKQVVAEMGNKVRITEGTAQGQIILESTDPAMLEKLRTLVKEIDMPTSCVFGRFVRVEWIDIVSAAERLSEQAQTCAQPDDSSMNQAIPEPRTNRVFLLGKRAWMDQAEKLLKEWDDARAIP